MIAYNISVGIQSLPHVLATTGIIPGLLIIVLVAFMAYHTSLIVWQAIMRYGFYSYPDILRLPFGRTGVVMGHVMQSLILLFLMSLHVLTMIDQWLAITSHKAPGVWIAVLGTVACFCFTMLRSLKDGAKLAMICESTLRAPLLLITGMLIML